MVVCLTSTLILVSLLGLAYIVWSFAGKEAGLVKLLGQLIAAVIAIIAIVLLIWGAIYGPQMKGKWMHKCGMGMGGMMGPKMMEEHKAMMKEHMKMDKTAPMMQKGKKAK